ncbi:MAG: hypothetical protein ACRD6W_03110, partial [Nitrososphaerales archaeon]
AEPAAQGPGLSLVDLDAGARTTRCGCSQTLMGPNRLAHDLSLRSVVNKLIVIDITFFAALQASRFALPTGVTSLMRDLDSLDACSETGTLGTMTANLHAGLGTRGSDKRYFDELVDELCRLIGQSSSTPVADEFGSPQVAARRIVEMLPKSSPWAPIAGPVYRTGQLQELLGISRQAIADRTKRRTLFALHTDDGHVVYPAFQFEGPDVLDGMSAVLRAVGDSIDEWTLLSWLRTPQPRLGANVIDYLSGGGDLPLAVEAAQRAAERWSR